MKKFSIVLFTLITHLIYAQESVGLISEAPDSISDKIAQWGKLVGNWDIVVDMLDEEGNVAQSFDAEWNWFYIMNGLAIQDVFILPRRAENIDPSNYFIGTGIRVYDDKNKKWQTTWIDTSTKKIEMREAASSDKEIIIIQDSEDGSKLKYTYYDMNDNTFRWKQESMNNSGGWKVTQTVVAKRKG